MVQRRRWDARGYSYTNDTSSGVLFFLGDPRVKLLGIFFATILVLFGIYRFFFASSDDGSIIQSSSPIVALKSATGSATIIDAKGGVRDINQSATPFLSQDGILKVSQWLVTLSGTGVKIILDRSSEIDYQRNDDTKINQFDLKSGNAWVELSTIRSEVFALKNFQIMSSADDSVLMLTQNGISSTVAVLQWKVSLSTKVASLTISAGDMVTLFAQDSEKPDLSDRIQPISDALKSSSLALSQGIDDFIQAIVMRWWVSSGTTLASDNTIVSLDNTWASIPSSSGAVIFWKYLEITSPKDGSTVNKNTIVVTWKIYSDSITKVLINEKQAVIGKEATFSLADVPLGSLQNTILYKALNAQGKILDSGYITVKNPTGIAPVTTTTQSNNFLLANEKLYYITEPKANPYQTTEKQVTIRGVVPKWKVKSIQVNGYTLKQFLPYSTTWKYTASKDGGNMGSDLNLYHIVYYGMNGENLGSTLYSIVLADNETSQTQVATGSSR